MLYSVIEHVMSNQAQPHEHSERSQSEIREAVLRALNTLPEDESRAIHERLGLGIVKHCTMLNRS